MTLTLQPAPRELVKSIRSRSRDLGITTADTYLREFQDCLDGACPSNILKDVTTQSWQRMMKRASRTLVYHGEGLDLGETLRVKEGSLPAGIELPPRSLGWTNVIVTTPTRDRDGDILETGGANLDERSAHLFNHLSSEVTGRVLKQTAHTKKVLKALLSIIDTAFGADVATMYEHGSLRTSHGFLPKKWEPLDDGDGYHILEFDILEVSGVSIPSNPDAGPVEFSRQKLTHPLLKEWGRMKFRNRRKVKPVGIDLRNLPADGIVITPAKPEAAHACTCSTKTAEQAMETKTVIPFSDAPVADKAWDADAAVKRGREWAGVNGDDPPASGFKKYRKLFAILDGDADNLGSYKFPYHDVDDGKLVLVPKGVAAAIGALNGARGGTKISDEDRKGAYAVLVKAYKKCFPDQDPPELKSLDEIQTKGVFVEFENSWDDIRCDLGEALQSFLMASGVCVASDLAYIVDMFPDRAIVCVCVGANVFYGPCDYFGPVVSNDDRLKYFRCTWAMNGEEPEWTGEPQQVEITPNIQPAAERALRAMSEKAFLKPSHVKSLGKAVDHMADAMDHEDATKATKGLATKAHDAFKSVLDAHEKGVLTGAHRKKLEKGLGYAAEGAEHEESTAPMKKMFKAAHGLVEKMMDDAGGADEAGTTPAAGATTEPAEKTIDTDTKAIKLGPEHTRKATAALHHFKAVEHHDEAGNEHVELARKATLPLQDMLNQVDSDPDDEEYEEGRGEPAAAKAAKLAKTNLSRINKSIEHGESLAKHKSATSHVKSLAKHAVAHLKAIVKPDDPAGEDGENGAEGTEGANGNPPKAAEAVGKSFNDRCADLLDEAIDLLTNDTGDALLSLASTGSKAGKLLRRRQAAAAQQ